MLQPIVTMIFGGGELSVLLAKKKLLAFARAHTSYAYTILSNCVVFSEEICEILKLGASNTLMCDLDAGTPETYLLVKGTDAFYDMIDHLKKYTVNGG